MIAMAPAASAESTKRNPSVLPPAIATNRSPFFTARLSAVTPVQATSPLPAAISASGGRMSRSLWGGGPHRAPALPAFLERGQYQLVGRRQVEPRHDTKERRDARHH